MTDNPKCDYATGTAFTGPHTCGRNAKWEWTDPAGKQRRPICGIHKRSVAAWYPADQTNVQPIMPIRSAG